MREIIDIRIPENWARERLGSVGQRVGELTRKIEIKKNDPLYERIASLVREQEKSGPLGLSVSIRREYSDSELNDAELLQLKPQKIFEPSGEECGTKYDEASACSICGAGRQQVSSLMLDLRKAPRGFDIACTIANEWIVSQRLAQIIIDEEITGCELYPVRHIARYEDDPIDFSRVSSGRELLKLAKFAGVPHPTWQFWVWLNRAEQGFLFNKAKEEYTELLRGSASRDTKPLPIWYQLKIISRPIHIVSPPTRFGINPFDEDLGNRYVCPLGHVKGLNLLSEIFISPETWDGSDIFITQEMVGVRRGLLVPAPMVLISPKLWNLLHTYKIKGYSVEVAYWS